MRGWRGGLDARLGQRRARHGARRARHGARMEARRAGLSAGRENWRACGERSSGRGRVVGGPRRWRRRDAVVKGRGRGTRRWRRWWWRRRELRVRLGDRRPGRRRRRGGHVDLGGTDRRHAGGLDDVMPLIIRHHPGQRLLPRIVLIITPLGYLGPEQTALSTGHRAGARASRTPFKGSWKKGAKARLLGEKIQDG
jgi:hypothetical protein